MSDTAEQQREQLNSGTKDRLLTFEQLGVDDLTVVSKPFAAEEDK